MSTGNFANWDGNLLDIGPIYPFVGWEGLMVALAVIFWIGWHVMQIRMENKQVEDETGALAQQGNLQKALDAERPIDRT